MTLSGTHEIVTRPWAGQASSARPRSRPAFALVAIGVPLATFGAYLAYVALHPGPIPSAAILIATMTMLSSFVLPDQIATWLGRFRYRNPIIDFDSGTMRIGPDITSFDEIDRAWTVAHEPRRPDDLYLFISGTGHRQARIRIRDANGDLLNEPVRALLWQLVERASIEVRAPSPDRWDPKRKFVSPGEPDYLTKERALALLAPTAIPRP